MSVFGPKRTLAFVYHQPFDRLYGQTKLGDTNVEIDTNRVRPGVHCGHCTSACIRTKAIVPRILHKAMRRGGSQKLLHAELHGKVQSKAQREKIEQPALLGQIRSGRVAAFGGLVYLHSQAMSPIGP